MLWSRSGLNVYDAIENEERVGEKAGKAEKYEHMQGSNEREKKNGGAIFKGDCAVIKL